MQTLRFIVFVGFMLTLGLAFAATAQVANWDKMIKDPVVLSLVASFISSIITMPLTEMLKRLGGWDGSKAQVLNGAVNAAVLAVLPFVFGVYTFDLKGLGMAALSAIVGYLADKYIYSTGKSFSGANKSPLEGQ